MTIENKLVPKGATSFIDKGCHATTSFVKNEDGTESTKMNMVVYSGGVIKNHWYWDDLLIDLEGGIFSRKKYPVLEDHITSRKIGFSGKPLVSERGLVLNEEDTIFVDTPESAEFQKLSKQGFPFQSSVRVDPKNIERVAEGAMATANGLTIKGPGTVFRKWEYIEGSICVFGWDGQTSSSAFAKDEEVLDYELVLSKPDTETAPKEVPTVMNREQFMKEHPELFKEIVDSTTAQVTASFTSEKVVMTETIQNLTSQLSESNVKITELARRDEIRTEKEMAQDADSIWNTQLKACELPERMFGKIKKGVDYNKFVKDGVLDKAGFSEAVKVEITEWSEFKVSVDPQIQGAGFTEKDIQREQFAQADIVKQADALFAHVSGRLAA